MMNHNGSCSCSSSSKWSLIVAMMLLVILLGSLTEAFVTTGPQLSSLSSSGSSLSSVTKDNGASRKSIKTTVMNEDDDDNDDNDDDEDDEVDGFASMMGVQAAASPGGQTVYVIEFESDKATSGGNNHHIRGGKDMSDDSSDGQSPLDPWSIVWYIGSFGGLIAFFLIVSCSEWCCRRGARSPLNIPYTQRGEVINSAAAGSNQTIVTESPPPPYHLFAPPPYDSVNYAEIADKGPSGEKLDIYVISLPIQAAATQPPPA